MTNALINGHFLISIFIVSGLITGSFLNVCIYRMPIGKSIFFPHSHCPCCGGRILPLDMVPVLSYLLLKGRCRSCGSKISAFYPSVELLTGLIFASIYLHYGIGAKSAKYLLLSAVLIVVAFIDLKHYIIPNRIIIFALLGGLVMNILARDLTFHSIALGFLSSGALLILLALASRGGMGGGDIKLAAAIGLYLGWPDGLLAVLLACMLAGAAGLALLLTRAKGRKDVIPFGPFIVVATFIVLFRGNELLRWYLGIL